MSSHRATFLATQPDVWLVDPEDTAAIDRHLRARGLAAAGELPSRVTRAGEGNMNLTLRVQTSRSTLILKQGRPWVEKYPDIGAPWDRTLVEGAFYRAVQDAPAVASRLPRLLDLDEHHHVLAISDLGAGGDFTGMYRDRHIASSDLDALLAWLAALARVPLDAADQERFANRAMRALNHEHIFHIPLAGSNGLDLDRFTPGLQAAADALKQDRAYVLRVAVLGRHYLEDAGTLVHGDYFPGSWVHTPDGVRIIDPEFCFAGARAFDYGVMLAHFALARTGVAPAAQVLAAARAEHVDETLVLGFAGTEIMRRLLGVAQLPLACGLEDKHHLLELSRRLLLTPRAGLEGWA